METISYKWVKLHKYLNFLFKKYNKQVGLIEPIAPTLDPWMQQGEI